MCLTKRRIPCTTEDSTEGACMIACCGLTHTWAGNRSHLSQGYTPLRSQVVCKVLVVLQAKALANARGQPVKMLKVPNEGFTDDGEFGRLGVVLADRLAHLVEGAEDLLADVDENTLWALLDVISACNERERLSSMHGCSGHDAMRAWCAGVHTP